MYNECNLAIDKETSVVAAYMKQKFPGVLLERSSINTPDQPDFIAHPEHWPLEFSVEVDLAVDVIACAFHNAATTDWDARRYADHIGIKNSGIVEDREITLLNSFKPIRTDYLEVNPCTISDCHGKLLVWYLPNILRPERQDSMFTDLRALERMLKVDAKSANWRSGPDFYRSVSGGLKPGTLNISPAWFEQGHESEDHSLKVSGDLLKDNCISRWLKECCLPFALIGGILSIIQPELYELGQEAFRQLRLRKELCDNPARMLEILAIWYTPFSGLAVISNRVTPLHRDTGGRPEWLDLMLALGNYDNGRFAIPAFGYTFKYNPGTLIGVSGKIFRHGATCDGDRASIAFYMRNNVLNRLRLPTGTWKQRADYEQLLPKQDPPDENYFHY